MSVKILLDPIFTAAPSRCSTFIQFATFMEYVLKQRQDVFFYCLLPDWELDQVDKDWLPQHPNIVYVQVPQHADRTKEYVTLRNEMDRLIAFNGELWDFDVMITVRSGLTALYKMLITSPRQVGLRFTKEIWVIEDMPLMSFKPSVLKLDPDVQDRFTLDGYLAADRVMIMSYHEKAGALQVARRWYAPSVVRHLEAKIKEVVPVQFAKFQLKDTKHWFVPGTEQQFGIAYVGRLVATGNNLDKIYRMMTNTWIIRGGDKVRMMVATVSVGGPKKAQPPSHIEKFYAPREEFWRIAREEMHVVVIMHNEAGFLLAMMEPIMLGTPVIVADEDWSRGQLGDSYPFYVKGEMDAYVLAKMFYEDYAGMYAKFAKWHEQWFRPTYERRFKEDMLYDVLCTYLHEFEYSALERFKAKCERRADNDIVKLLVEGEPKELVVFDVLQKLSDSGRLQSLDRKLEIDDRENRGLVWSTAWNDFRFTLKAFYGYEDASVRVGHLRKAQGGADAV